MLNVVLSYSVKLQDLVTVALVTVPVVAERTQLSMGMVAGKRLIM